jgi:hypothetical protein
MRLIIGKLIWHNFNYKNFWFRPKKFENKFYKAIKVKKWKDKMPSYNPEGYLITVTSLDEIIETMCRNEVIHEFIALLSYVPLLFTLFAGEFWVFFVTSIIASLFDLIFVILQRYNRPRLIRLKEKQMNRGKLQ